MKSEEYFKSLSDADCDKAEAIEKELVDCLAEGASESVSLGFTQTVMELRAKGKAVTVSGALEFIQQAGLSVLRHTTGLEKTKAAGKRHDVRVVGVPGNRRGRAGVSVREA